MLPQTTGNNNNLVDISPLPNLFKMAGTSNVPRVYKIWGAEPPNVWPFVYFFPKSHFRSLFNWDKTKTKHPLPNATLF